MTLFIDNIHPHNIHLHKYETYHMSAYISTERQWSYPRLHLKNPSFNCSDSSEPILPIHSQPSSPKNNQFLLTILCSVDMRCGLDYQVHFIMSNKSLTNISMLLNAFIIETMCIQIYQPFHWGCITRWHLSVSNPWECILSILCCI